jgi:hypothetical protein
MNYYYIIGLTIVILALIALVTYFIVYIVVTKENNIIDNSGFIDITLEVIDGKTLFTTTFDTDYITVDYGDGTIQTFINPTQEILHYYPGNGTYNVKFYNFKNLKTINIDTSEAGGSEFTNEVKLTSIFFSKTIDSLELLNIYDGKLKSVDLTKLPNLTGLDVGTNELTSLDFSKTLKLQGLGCGSNVLSKLEISNLVDLTRIDCSSNVIEKLDTSKLNSLNVLYCNNNPNLNLILPDYKFNLTALVYSSTNNSNLDLTEYINLIDIACDYNNISTFKFPNPVTKIEILGISGNNITTSYDFTPFTSLTGLYTNDMLDGFTLTLSDVNYSKITYLSIKDSNQNSTAIDNILSGFADNAISDIGDIVIDGDSNGIPGATGLSAITILTTDPKNWTINVNSL